MEQSSVLLSTAYCGPVHYFSLIEHNTIVFIEQHEHFIRQTYRNRCVIMGSNGTENLIIPVEHGRRPGLRIRDVRIAWYEKWQMNHRRAIYSAYSNSPFFAYYFDDLRIFYEKKWTFLFEYNMEFLEKLMELINLKKEIRLTENFEQVPGCFANYREAISPKNHLSEDIPGNQPFPYTQVFDGKFPFFPNLSILDLLFNTGPEAGDILKTKPR